MSPRERLDVAMTRRGLVASRTEARSAIAQGMVTVGGRPAEKPATLVDVAEAVVLSGPPRRFVSRGGDKLDAALTASGIDVMGARCLDAGASTGGFTDRLLQGGAREVVAVDVGYGQLAWSIRTDPRVVVHERCNIRHADITALGAPFDVVVADLSFISLRTVLPTLADCVRAGGAFVFLVKPQFEVGPAAVGKGGVVRDPSHWTSCLESVIAAAGEGGLHTVGLIASPVVGPAGNVEFLMWGLSEDAAATDDGQGQRRLISDAVATGIALRQAS